MNKGLLLLVGLMVSPWAMSAPDKVAYELQERCGKATKAEFVKNYGESGMMSSKFSNTVADYKNHYNSKLNRCFYLLSTTYLIDKPDAVSLESTALWDINESNLIGEYRSQGVKSHCEFKGIECKSKESFDALIKPYMEE